MSRRRGRWIAAGLLFLLPLCLMYAPGLPHGKYELVVDIQVGDAATVASGNVEVWIDSPLGEPLRQTIISGQRRSYRFSLEGHKTVDFLRIDPVNDPNVPIWLFGIHIENQGEIIHAFTPRDLAGWYTNVEQSTLEEDALVLRAGHDDSRLAGAFPTVSLPGAHRSFLGRLALYLVSREHYRENALVLLTVSVLLVVLLGLRRGGALDAAVLAIALPLTHQVLLWTSRLGGHPPEGSSALGYALYAGYPKSTEMYLGPLLIGVPILTALVAVYFSRRLLKAPALDTVASLPTSGEWKKTRILILGIAIAALACSFWPDLAAARPSAASPIALNWDGNNFLVWRYLFQNDARPYTDFWFPYSGQIFFEAPYSFGEVCIAVHRLILFAIFLVAVYLSTGRTLTATLAIFGTIFGLYLYGCFEWPERYGVVVNVVLAYAAIDRSKPRLQAVHFLFWAALVQAALIEPSSALYAGAPLFVAFLLDALRSPRTFFAQLPGRMVREFALPAAVLAGVGIYLAIQGELTGFFAFMSSLGTQAAYGAYPIDLPAWLQLKAPPEAFLLGSIVVLIGLGAAREFTGWQQKDNDGRVLLLLGIAAAMLMVKQFLRPHIADQLLVVSVVGLLFYLFGNRKNNAWQWGGSVFAAGLLFAHLATSNAPMQVVNQVRGVVARVRTSLPCLALDAHERKALTALLYNPNRFLLSQTQRQTVQELAGLLGPNGARRLFVLSDDPILYLMTGTRPYFHTNGYNAAPIQEQKHMLQLLRSEPPRIVVWRATDQGVDAVPPVLRDTLLYEYVILHYVPMATVSHDPFVFLRPRRPEEPVAVDFWYKRLGNILNLGHIARFSSMARFPKPAGREGEEAADFLTVKITNFEAANALPPPPIANVPQIGGYLPEGRSIIVPIECAGRYFALALSIVPGQSEYHVLLNRVWFWGALKKAGFSPAIGDPGPGIEVHLERRAMNDDILY